MHHYCTLFDSNYLTRGIAMLESLHKHSQNYHLYILAFDDLAYHTLIELAYPHVTVISMHKFEDPTLLSIKPTRTRGEYCWTCTPSLILYCIETYRLSHCTYLDADLYFYADPSILIHEMKGASILITRHRYTPRYNQEKTSGIYCVQFMTFYSDQRGMKALRWWRERCIEWCYARFENGKFGDQKYLDDWMTRFEGVHVLQHLGGGLAPWNIQQFSHISPIFYHFHHLKFIGEDKIDLGPYFLPPLSIQTIYAPYIKHLLILRQKFGSNNFDGRSTPPWTWKTPLRYIKRKLQKSYNLFKIQKFQD
ncbi:glycosyl transferase [Helicobacter pametensis]|uniref:glycosyl transferase n=1 Tax=Helicobacter pametensis TaxID=95149 RepID=UPI000CF16BF0|nr:glycosyl transferase [Helicobacter pametensis]